MDAISRASGIEGHHFPCYLYSLLLLSMLSYSDLWYIIASQRYQFRLYEWLEGKLAYMQISIASYQRVMTSLPDLNGRDLMRFWPLHSPAFWFIQAHLDRCVACFFAVMDGNWSRYLAESKKISIPLKGFPITYCQLFSIGNNMVHWLYLVIRTIFVYKSKDINILIDSGAKIARLGNILYRVSQEWILWCRNDTLNHKFYIISKHLETRISSTIHSSVHSSHSLRDYRAFWGQNAAWISNLHVSGLRSRQLPGILLAKIAKGIASFSRIHFAGVLSGCWAHIYLHNKNYFQWK